MSSDDDEQERLENNLITSTGEWIARLIGLHPGEPHGKLVIDGDDWNEHLREDTGGGLTARELAWSSLWSRMKDRLKAEYSVRAMSMDLDDYSVSVEW
jgi:hypothetical protein